MKIMERANELSDSIRMEIKRKRSSQQNLVIIYNMDEKELKRNILP